MEMNKNLKLFIRIFLSIIIIFSIPYIRNYFFPDKMTRVYNLLTEAKFYGCALAVDRVRKGLLLFTITKGGAEKLTTEIFIEKFNEIKLPNGEHYFFSHSINNSINGFYYLTRTLIVTDAEMKRIQHIEATVCDRLLDPSGHVDYDGYEPIIKCADPVKSITCSALE